jgi:hypothetical protein
MKTIALASIFAALALAPGAQAKQTIHKTLHVGARTVHWQTQPVADQSNSDIQIRVNGRMLLIETDSSCSGTANWRDLVVRVNACGKGSSPIKFAAVRLTARRALTVRLRIVVTKP